MRGAEENIFCIFRFSRAISTRIIFQTSCDEARTEEMNKITSNATKNILVTINQIFKWNITLSSFQGERGQFRLSFSSNILCKYSNAFHFFLISVAVWFSSLVFPLDTFYRESKHNSLTPTGMSIPHHACTSVSDIRARRKSFFVTFDFDAAFLFSSFSFISIRSIFPLKPTLNRHWLLIDFLYKLKIPFLLRINRFKYLVCVCV